MATVYIETSIVGYMTARSRDAVIFQARQELTRKWWHSRRKHYRVVASQLVLDEAARGDEEAALERLRLLEGVALLDVTDLRIAPVAEALLDAHLLPEAARSDADHIAVATVHGVDYLLTWNCKHIANADTLPKIYRLLTELGYVPPLVVTPEEFSADV